MLLRCVVRFIWLVWICHNCLPVVAQVLFWYWAVVSGYEQGSSVLRLVSHRLALFIPIPVVGVSAACLCCLPCWCKRHCWRDHSDLSLLSVLHRECCSLWWLGHLRSHEAESPSFCTSCVSNPCLCVIVGASLSCMLKPCSVSCVTDRMGACTSHTESGITIGCPLLFFMMTYLYPCTLICVLVTVVSCVSSPLGSGCS